MVVMVDHTAPEQYLQEFVGGDRQKEALKQALDIRKFEIELYWKRATYFWVFIGAAMTAYFALTNSVGSNSGGLKNTEAVYFVTCLGLVFSVAWYFVNRGSKAWQENWELHVDLLEDAVMGPLYKSILRSREYCFWRLNRAYGFSVSKINHILSLFVIVMWLILTGSVLVPLLSNFYPCAQDRSWTVVAITVATLGTLISLFCFGQTDTSKKPRTAQMQARSYQPAGKTVSPKLMSLIITLKTCLLPAELAKIVIFGSASIVMNGVALGREAKDLDVFVSDESFDALAERFPLQWKQGNAGERVPYLQPAKDIEILKTFLGVTFEQVFGDANTTENSGGLLVASLKDARAWKAAQNRQKDQSDIEAIDKHLRSGDSPTS
jgi:hypothetical protein